jgi:putative SOS response-associated peptidase YedK
MCGRVEFSSSSVVAERLGVKDSVVGREGDNNAVPYKGTFLFGLVDKAPDTLRHFHWPLIPSWCAEYPAYNTSNARSEDMHTKPAYKHLLGKRHCVIAVDGFYEWKRKGKDRTPYHFSMADGSMMMYAGLWDYNTKLDPPVLSCTIITREPNEIIGEIHDRMPVILTPDQVKLWLDRELSFTERSKVLEPIENSALLRRVVGESVNKAGNKSGDWFNTPGTDDACVF